MDLQPNGKTALVIGSGKGIGEAIARILAREGAHVLSMDATRHKPTMSPTSLPCLGFSAHPLVGDLTEASIGLAGMLIAERERAFVAHMMRQQAYDPAALEGALDGYARCLAQRGALRAGIAYFRAHRCDAERNRDHAKRKIEMPVLSVGGAAGFGAGLEDEIRPLATNHRHVMLDR